MISKSSDMQRAEAKAEEVCDKLGAYDFSANDYVRVTTDEGCEFTFASAFVLTYGHWYLVFAEHYDPHVFNKNDIEQIFQYRIITYQDQFPSVHDFIPKKVKKGKK
jgi:hypothetical protein